LGDIEAIPVEPQAISLSVAWAELLPKAIPVLCKQEFTLFVENVAKDSIPLYFPEFKKGGGFRAKAFGSLQQAPLAGLFYCTWVGVRPW
jgi:hypothetical protein